MEQKQINTRPKISINHHKIKHPRRKQIRLTNFPGKFGNQTNWQYEKKHAIKNVMAYRPAIWATQAEENHHQRHVPGIRMCVQNLENVNKIWLVNRAFLVEAGSWKQKTSEHQRFEINKTKLKQSSCSITIAAWASKPHTYTWTLYTVSITKHVHILQKAHTKPLLRKASCQYCRTWPTTQIQIQA